MLLIPLSAYLMLIVFMYICTACAVTIYFAENTINSLVSLLMCVVFSSCSLLLLRVEFLSLVYIIVYAGAVVVLFVFVILSTDLRKEDTVRNKRRLRDYKVANFLVFSLTTILGLFSASLKADISFFNEKMNDYIYVSEFMLNDVHIFSKFFYTEFFVLFIVLGILLLTVMVGSIALCMKHLENF